MVNLLGPLARIYPTEVEVYYTFQARLPARALRYQPGRTQQVPSTARRATQELMKRLVWSMSFEGCKQMTVTFMTLLRRVRHWVAHPPSAPATVVCGQRATNLADESRDDLSLRTGTLCQSSTRSLRRSSVPAAAGSPRGCRCCSRRNFPSPACFGERPLWHGWRRRLGRGARDSQCYLFPFVTTPPRYCRIVQAVGHVSRLSYYKLERGLTAATAHLRLPSHS